MARVTVSNIASFVPRVKPEGGKSKPNCFNSNSFIKGSPFGGTNGQRPVYKRKK